MGGCVKQGLPTKVPPAPSLSSPQLSSPPPSPPPRPDALHSFKAQGRNAFTSPSLWFAIHFLMMIFSVSPKIMKSILTDPPSPSVFFLPSPADLTNHATDYIRYPGGAPRPVLQCAGVRVFFLALRTALPSRRCAVTLPAQPQTKTLSMIHPTPPHIMPYS